MAWIDLIKAYDMTPQMWMIKRLKMYKITDKIKNLITDSREITWVELIAGEKHWKR